MLEFCGVSSGYGRREVLHSLSACFEKGRMTCVIGPNGCGKSTLLKTAAGLLPVRAGTVTVDGAALCRMTPVQSARRIAYLAQEHAAPDMTAGELVLHGRFAHLRYPRRYGRRDREIARAAMERLGIGELAGRPMRELSGGMRQLCYIAMALAQEADYILLDEPTSSLDIANRLQLMDVLRALAADGHGIVAVLHDLTLAMEYADTVTVLCGGGLLISGVPEDVCASGAVREAFGVGLRRSEDASGGAYYVVR
ncbi:MAG: ABC transporter ATP-binding protein [Clostridiaceae bacterium]|nr:ABC transporter ATP-binding protein [Clostridiaceae bacterium]